MLKGFKCVECGEVQAANFYFGNKGRCKSCCNKRAKKYNLSLKQGVLTYYGNGKCACVKCGESRLACLSIDHINGRVGEHRRGWGGTRIYLWLRRNDHPDGYQTLCMNCQFAKRVENEEYARGGAYG